MDRPKSPDADATRAWWEKLSSHDAAALRHCKSLVEVAMHRQGLTLARALSWSKYRPEHAAGLAQILAHVKADSSERIMWVCGFKKWGRDTGALLTERRYERLVTTRDVLELTTALIRLVQMMDGKSNVAELGTWLQWWLRADDTASFNRTMRQIGEDYYAASIPEDEAALNS